MTQFFEWFLTSDTNGALKAEGRIGADWKHITNKAAERLRDRIKELARVRSISLSLNDLLEMVEGHNVIALTLESRYGIRRFPIKGLFCDKPVHEMDAAAQEWADQLLSVLLGEMNVKDHFPDLKNGIHLADTVWKAYLDERRVRERLELGKLVTELKKGNTIDLSRLMRGPA